MARMFRHHLISLPDCWLHLWRQCTDHHIFIKTSEIVSLVIHLCPDYYSASLYNILTIFMCPIGLSFIIRVCYNLSVKSEACGMQICGSLFIGLFGNFPSHDIGYNFLWSRKLKRIKSINTYKCIIHRCVEIRTGELINDKWFLITYICKYVYICICTHSCHVNIRNVICVRQRHAFSNFKLRLSLMFECLR